MTREQHIKFCKKCINRKLDLEVGLLCNLTGDKADFENECKSFDLDTSVIERLDNSEAVEHSTALENLSKNNLIKFKSEQEYSKALISGLIMGLIGALLWAVITVSTGFKLGYIALAIGAGVGLTIRYMGKGIDQIFGITGALIALLSCLLGNFFSIIGSIANYEGLGYIETLTLFDYGQLIPLMIETFSPLDILFYGIAGYEGYKFSFRTFTERDLYELEK